MVLISLYLDDQPLSFNDDYFLFPEVNYTQEGNTQIFIKNNPEKLIDLSLTESTIKVLIPENFYYETPEGYQIKSNLISNYSYKINNTTQEKAEITIMAKPEYGTISQWCTNQTFYLGQEIFITFEPFTNYKVDEWKYLINYGKDDQASVDPDILEIITNKNNVFKAKLKTQTNNIITIFPECSERYSIHADFRIKNGDTTPYNTQTLYSNDVINISARPYSEYFFLKWNVVNPDDYSPISNLNKIVDINLSKAEQQITIKELDKSYNILFTSELATRPDIILISPPDSSVNTSGIIRDSTFQIMFDRKMNENSIYFTDNERADILSKFSSAVFDDAHKTEDGRYYGYVYNNQVFYKNISIKNLISDVSILENYGKPYFTNSQILVIPVNKSNPPQKGIQILVTVDPGFYCTTENIDIPMNKPKQWYYYISNARDSEKPDLTIDSIQGQKKNSNNYSEFVESQHSSENNLTFNTLEKLQNITIKSEKLKIAANLLDKDSGPASISMVVYNFNTNTLTNEAVLISDSSEQNMYFGNYSSSTPVPQEIDLTEYFPGYSFEGLNYIQFIGKDNLSNQTESDYYYFYIANKAPDFPSEPVFTVNQTERNKLDIYWDNPADLDFDYVSFEYHKDGQSPSTPIIFDKSTTSTSLTLDYFTKYHFTLSIKDTYGNIKNYTKTITMPFNVTYEINNNIILFTCDINNINYNRIELLHSEDGINYYTFDNIYYRTSTFYVEQQGSDLIHYYKISLYKDDLPLSDFDLPVIIYHKLENINTERIAVNNEKDSIKVTWPKLNEYDGIIINYKKISDKTYNSNNEIIISDKSKTEFTITNNFEIKDSYDIKIIPFVQINSHEKICGPETETECKCFNPPKIENFSIERINVPGTSISKYTYYILSWNNPTVKPYKINIYFSIKSYRGTVSDLNINPIKLPENTTTLKFTNRGPDYANLPKDIVNLHTDWGQYDTLQMKIVTLTNDDDVYTESDVININELLSLTYNDD